MFGTRLSRPTGASPRQIFGGAYLVLDSIIGVVQFIINLLIEHPRATPMVALILTAIALEIWRRYWKRKMQREYGMALIAAIGVCICFMVPLSNAWQQLNNLSECVPPGARKISGTVVLFPSSAAMRTARVFFGAVGDPIGWSGDEGLNEETVPPGTVVTRACVSAPGQMAITWNDGAGILELSADRECTNLCPDGYVLPAGKQIKCECHAESCKDQFCRIQGYIQSVAGGS
jgi:hypothetical protein